MNIENKLIQACDCFRGVLTPDKYKDYILIVLFIKYISETNKCDKATLVLPNGCSIDELYKSDDICESINNALSLISQANEETLKDVLNPLDFSIANKPEITKRMTNLVECINSIEIDVNEPNNDVIGDAYMFLIDRFSKEAKYSGEFYTPTSLSKLLTLIANPKDNDKICDPTCGSGGLLIEAYKHNRTCKLYGMELNKETWAMCKINMVLYGCDDARIECCNSITDPKLKEGDELIKFNVILGNPPFSVTNWMDENTDNDPFNRFWRGIPPKNKGDYAFISHMIEVALPKEGRVAVIVPHGILFRAGAEGKIRQQLIEENLLDAVIGLPSQLFITTNIPVAILVFDRSREKGGINQDKKDVLIIDASQEYEFGKKQNTITNDQIEKIVDTFNKRISIPKYSHLASFEEIKNNNFDLNIKLYVDTSEEEQEIDLIALQNETDELMNEVFELRKQISNVCKNNIIME